jgi:hypothetical protein
MSRTDDRQELADRIHDRLRADPDLRRIADLLASKPDHQLLGATEFELRDHLLRLGAKALEAALAERKKGGTSGRARPARTAARRPASTAGKPSRS